MGTKEAQSQWQTYNRVGGAIPPHAPKKKKKELVCVYI